MRSRMSSKWPIGVVVLLCLAQPGSAQILYRSRSGSERDPRPLEELRRAAHNRETHAILALGAKKDRGSLAWLQAMAATPFPPREELAKTIYKDVLIEEYHDANIAARMALARMGVDGYLDDFIVGLSTSSVDWRVDCFRALGFAGDLRVVKFLGPFLYDDKMPKRPHASVIQSNAVNAIEALQELLPEVDAAQRQKNLGVNFRQGWRRWWEENKGKYK